MQFIDEVKIFVRSGSGGVGSVSFRREKFVDQGGPDGGDGGRGGDIIFEAVAGLNTLIDFRYKQHFKAENGKAGKGRGMYGRAGQDLIIQLPVGTEIRSEQDAILLCDMTEIGQRFVAIEGGKGGWGNIHFKSSVTQAPYRRGKEDDGREEWLILQLKLLSDIGLLGLPNAGKSTFLHSVTRARPKIADYAFTTLKPQLGVISNFGSELVVADLPGLIAGASDGKGLGDRFLKHIERCNMLLHLIDGSLELADIIENYNIIRNELASFDKTLTLKQELIALTKIDMISATEQAEKILALKKLFKKDVYPISCFSRAGLEDLVKACFQAKNEPI